MGNMGWAVNTISTPNNNYKKLIPKIDDLIAGNRPEAGWKDRLTSALDKRQTELERKLDEKQETEAKLKQPSEEWEQRRIDRGVAYIMPLSQ